MLGTPRGGAHCVEANALALGVGPEAAGLPKVDAADLQCEWPVHGNPFR